MPFELLRRPIDGITHRQCLVMGCGHRIGLLQQREAGIVPGDRRLVDRIIGGNVLGGPRGRMSQSDVTKEPKKWNNASKH